MGGRMVADTQLVHGANCFICESHENLSVAHQLLRLPRVG